MMDFYHLVSVRGENEAVAGLRFEVSEHPLFAPSPSIALPVLVQSATFPRGQGANCRTRGDEVGEHTTRYWHLAPALYYPQGVWQ